MFWMGEDAAATIAMNCIGECRDLSRDVIEAFKTWCQRRSIKVAGTRLGHHSGMVPNWISGSRLA